MEIELTMPSYLSLLRLILAPFVLIFILLGHNIPAFVLFIIAVLSDLMDCYIVKKIKATKLSSALNPLADKILIGLTMIGLAVKFNFPLWALIIFLARDIILISAAVIIYGAVKEFKPILISKINLWFQVGTIISYIINFRFKNLILLIAIILTIISFIQYILKSIKKR